jgi:hypothetical protein
MRLASCATQIRRSNLLCLWRVSNTDQNRTCADRCDGTRVPSRNVRELCSFPSPKQMLVDFQVVEAYKYVPSPASTSLLHPQPYLPFKKRTMQATMSRDLSPSKKQSIPLVNMFCPLFRTSKPVQKKLHVLWLGRNFCIKGVTNTYDVSVAAQFNILCDLHMMCLSKSRISSLHVRCRGVRDQHGTIRSYNQKSTSGTPDVLGVKTSKPSTHGCICLAPAYKYFAHRPRSFSLLFNSSPIYRYYKELIQHRMSCAVNVHSTETYVLGALGPGSTIFITNN